MHKGFKLMVGFEVELEVELEDSFILVKLGADGDVTCELFRMEFARILQDVLCTNSITTLIMYRCDLKHGWCYMIVT